jgi:hypothetical protein
MILYIMFYKFNKYMNLFENNCSCNKEKKFNCNLCKLKQKITMQQSPNGCKCDFHTTKICNCETDAYKKMNKMTKKIE